MSLVRRALRAAYELRDGADLAALRDAARAASTDLRGDGGDALRREPPAGGDADRRALATARALGAPDPFGLVTADEAEAALGVPTANPTLTYGDDGVGVRFAPADPADGELTVSAFHAADAGASPFDAATHWHEFLAPVLADEADEVHGVGHAALRPPGALYVLGPTTVLHLTLRRPDGAASDDALEILARRVLGRLATDG